MTLAGAINQKMVLVKFVQDQKMNIFRYGKEGFKKFVSPYYVYNFDLNIDFNFQTSNKSAICQFTAERA